MLLAVLAFRAMLAIAAPAAVLADPTAAPNAAALADAGARSGGNDKVSARAIGERLFANVQPAQVLKITVIRVGDHRVCGLLVSGVKFHGSLDRAGFRDEIVRLTSAAFAAAPIEEVDVTAIVPIAIGRGEVVSGDLAMPTTRTVFTSTSLRGESPDAFAKRINASQGIFWNSWFLVQLAPKHAVR